MGANVPGDVTIAILSDIHYAGAAERARGDDYELRAIANPLLRTFAHAYRHVVWMRHPLDQAPQLDRFLAEIGPVDYVVANGDYSCDSGFVGVSDPAAGQSAQECLGKLRAKFGDRARFVIGDHELGKQALFGGGEMRLASWRTATETLGLPPFWQLVIGRYTLMGMASSLIALPVYQPDTLPAEWPEWLRLREAHLAEICGAFDALPSNQRVILFCHDPTALPFLWREEFVRRRSAANRTNHHRAPAHATDFVEEPGVVRHSAHPISGTCRQPHDGGSARSPLLVAIPCAALPCPFRHRTAERRRLFHDAD